MTLVVEARGVVHDRTPALIAGLARCSNGDLLSACNSGGDLSAGQVVEVYRSHDDAVTWSDAGTRCESVFRGGGIEAGCSLTRLPSGRLLLPYADGFYLRPGTEDLRRRALLFCPFSDDDGITWHGGKAQPFEGLEAFAYGRVAVLPSGELLLPLWGAYDRPGRWVPGVLRSRDDGESWVEYRPIADRGNETPIALLADHRLLALIRGYTPDLNRTFFISHSEDGGETWSPPEPVNLSGTSPSLHAAPDGRVLAGYRSERPDGSCDIASSMDGGRTWSFETTLEPPIGRWRQGGYPVLIDMPKDRFLATFHNADPAWNVSWNLLRWA